MSRLSLSIVLSVLLLAGTALPGQAQSAENVAVIINDASPDSRRIGEHYASVRGVPAGNVFRITTATAESISAADFARTIEQPLAAAIRSADLHDRLLYLVLTKGVPLRITGSTGPKGTLASVDSELTLLYRRMAGHPVLAPGGVENPYFLGSRPLQDARRFTHREHDIYLVTRLDAFTVDEVIALIDRAQQPRPDGRIVLDQRAAPTGPPAGDDWLKAAADRLTLQGHGERVLLDATQKPVRDVDGVIGYFAWGAADPANRVRNVGMRFTPGSIAGTLGRFDARTFREPPETWKPSAPGDSANAFAGASENLIGDLIREGVSAVAGQIDEPYVFGATRPDLLFPAYLAGFNLAEAFYLATPVLSWQQVIVGDPLMTPFTLLPRLTRQEIEDEVDAVTALPGVFSRHRVGVARRANPLESLETVALVVRAQTLSARNDTAGARAALEKASALSPKSTTLLLSLALLEERADAYDLAIANYRRVLELQPNHAVALNNLAYNLAVRKNQPAEALPFAQKALSLAPKAATIMDTVAWIEHLLGNHAAAVRLLAAAVKLEPRNAELRLHAAVVYDAIGDAARATAELTEALKLDPALADRDEVKQLKAKKTPSEAQPR